MKKLVLLAGVTVVFGCGRSSVPSDSFVKECMQGRFYYVIKCAEVLKKMYPKYPAKPMDKESATQQALQILPDSAEYARKNSGRIRIVSITKTEKGTCLAEVKYEPDKTGNELFDSYIDNYRAAQPTSFKLSFIFDERQRKWLIEEMPWD